MSEREYRVDYGAGGVTWAVWATPWAWDDLAHWTDNTGALGYRACLTTACGALVPITQSQGPMLAHTNSFDSQCPACLQVLGRRLAGRTEDAPK